MSAEDAAKIEALLKSTEEHYDVKAIEAKSDCDLVGVKAIQSSLEATKKAERVKLMKAKAKGKAQPTLMKANAKGKVQPTKKKIPAGSKVQSWGKGYNQAGFESIVKALWGGLSRWQSQKWNARAAAAQGAQGGKGKGKWSRVKGKGKGKWQRKGTAEERAERTAWRISRYGPAPIHGTRKLSAKDVDRMDETAALAESYFGHQPAKKQKVDLSAVSIAQEVLDKAPDNAQTCRSLQVFLEKKLQKELPAAPDVSGPDTLKNSLEAHADGLGRLHALQSTSGWDARAKRALDIVAVTKTPAAEKVLDAASKDLEKGKSQLEKLLKDHGDGSKLEACVEKRVAWMKDWLQREGLFWCLKVLRARDASLTGESVVTGSKEMGYIDILEVLLSGEGSLSTPVAPEAEPKAEAAIETNAEAKVKADAKPKVEATVATQESKAEAKKGKRKAEAKDKPKA